MPPTDDMLRQGIKDKLTPWIEKLRCEGDVEKQWFYKSRFIEKLQHKEIAIETDKANEQHYEVPTEFFTTVLGKRQKYSGCYWPENVTTLEEAEDISLQIICERAKVEDGQVILDLGSGWGSFGLYVCEKFPNCKVTTVSNSKTQQAHIKARGEKCGWSGRLETIVADANTFSIEKKFDRIISLEMFEHMKNYEKLFERVASWLQPSGLLYTQILCHKEFAYNFDSEKGSDTEWMARNFFSGGTMPSADLFLYFQKHVTLEDHWRLNGKHYSKTLEAWLTRLDQNKEAVEKIFIDTYGAEESRKHMFNWRLFFIFCSEAFGYSDGNEWIVAAHLFKKNTPITP